MTDKKPPNELANQQARRWSAVDQGSSLNVLDSMYYTSTQNKRGQAAQAPYVDEDGAGISNSQMFLHGRNTTADIKKNTMEKLSQTRQEYLRELNERSIEGSGRPNLGLASTSRVSLTKTASAASTMTGNRGGSSANTTHLAPDVYSPLFLTQNIQLPRQRSTANAWNRAFYDTNPYVKNAINLHATYPISKYTLKCEDKNVEKFFNDMAEKIDLQTAIQNTAAEWYKIGEAFPYASFDETNGMWDQIYLHNPDYIRVRASPIPTKSSSISLKPDPELEKIVMSPEPEYTKLREQLDPKIIYHVLRGEYIPLDDFNISHLRNLSSPYDIRGTSIITSVWKELILLDKYKECFDVETEVLTSSGFKKYNEVIEINDDGNAVPRGNFKIACYNPKKKNIEYHAPISATLRKHTGKMIHFDGMKVDVMVTPGHRMYAKKKKKNGWTDYHTVEAKDISRAYYYKFLSQAKWEGIELENIEVAGKTIDADLYLKFLGYVISEGCVHVNDATYQRKIAISQLPESDCYEDIKETFFKIATIFERKSTGRMVFQDTGYSAGDPKEIWRTSIDCKELAHYLAETVGEDGKTTSHFKRIPRWVLELSPRQLNIILFALVKGDGSDRPSKYGTDTIGYSYSTVSKGLADDVCELVYKIGEVPIVSSYIHKYDDRDDVIEYLVSWSDGNYGNEPLVYGNKEYGGADINEVDYNDFVWCFEVPTDLFITRRNGRITIQHNCKFAQADGMINPITLVKVGTDGAEGLYPRAEELEAWRNILEAGQFDKDFKIVTHNAVDISRIGYSGQIVDTAADVTQLIDNIFIGLMVPKSILTQEGATYASASVALDVMRQRYNAFRTMMANWLEKKIFAPISEIQGFYKLENKTKRLIIPQVEWNHMTLYDLDNYIAHISTLVERNRVSMRTLDRSLGLNRASENSNIRQELIEAAILEKEKGALGQMTLAELRALDPEEPIVVQEKEKTALPGQGAPGAPGGLGGLGGPGADLLGGLSGGAPPPGGPDLLGGGGLGGMGPPPMGAVPGNPTSAPTPPPMG